MYKSIYDRASAFKKIGEIFTWVFLLFLIPATALGYFAEQSIPGQTLFPVKLGIERLVLGLESFSPQAQASYQVDLVNKRFDEIQTLLTKDTTNADDLSNFGVQLQQATEYINSLPSSPEKTQLQEKLTSNIQTYQEQIKIQQQVIQNRIAIVQAQTASSIGNYTGKASIPTVAPSPTVIPTPTPTPTAITQQFKNTTVYNPPTPTSIPTPTFIPTPTSVPNDDNTSDLQTIDQTLQNIQNQLTSSDQTIQQNTQPPATSQHSTSNSPTSSPTPTPNLTLLCSQHGGHCISTFNSTHCPAYFITQYDYPNSCTSQYPICCSNYVPPTPTPTPNLTLLCSQHGGHCISTFNSTSCAKIFITQYDYPASCTSQYPICCEN